MDDLNEAIARYIGWSISAFPKEDAARVVERFGMVLAPALVERVRALLDELRAIQPDWTRHTLVTASRSAAMLMKNGHPELDDPAVAAFEWIYSWWWK